MAVATDFEVHPQQGNTARVFCSHCKAEIGRITTVPKDLPDDEARKRAEEVEGELMLIADEHLPNCPATRD